MQFYFCIIECGLCGEKRVSTGHVVPTDYICGILMYIFGQGRGKQHLMRSLV